MSKDAVEVAGQLSWLELGAKDAVVVNNACRQSL